MLLVVGKVLLSSICSKWKGLVSFLQIYRVAELPVEHLLGDSNPKGQMIFGMDRALVRQLNGQGRPFW